MNILKKNNDSLAYQLIRDFETDAVRINAHQCSVISNTIIDTRSENSESAHRDAIQIIPPSIHGLYNQQYAGAIIYGAIIMGNHIHAPGSQLQGIFASDGLFKSLWIKGNIINTDSQHEITINGLKSGHISQNYTSSGDLAKVRLYPLRLGGWIDGKCTWIIGFKEQKDDYLPVEEIVFDSDLSHVQDYRGSILNPDHVYLTNFDLFEWLIFAGTLREPDAVSLCRAVQKHAPDFGDKVFLT